MKIIVNRILIDVDYIYGITEIKNDFDLKFDILFLNDKTMTVDVSLDNLKELNLRPENFTSFTKEEKLEFWNNHTLKRIELFNNLNEIRNVIIKIWSENQTKFPTFKI